MTKIAIDAGHGMTTPGKRTPDGIREWTMNSAVASAMERRLKAHSVEVLRLDDTSGAKDIPLATRCKNANNWGADYVISIHHNAFTGVMGNHGGTETYKYRTITGGATQRLVEAVHNAALATYGLRNRGVKKDTQAAQGGLAMLRDTKAPAVLVELGFMDSNTDHPIICNPANHLRMGKALADAVLRMLGITPKPDAPVVTPPAETGELYRVQVGAFASKANAERLKAELESKGYSVIIKRG